MFTSSLHIKLICLAPVVDYITPSNQKLKLLHCCFTSYKNTSLKRCILFQNQLPYIIEKPKVCHYIHFGVITEHIKLKVHCWGIFQWDNIHTVFHNNQSSGWKADMHTHKQKMSILYGYVLSCFGKKADQKGTFLLWC